MFRLIMVLGTVLMLSPVGAAWAQGNADAAASAGDEDAAGVQFKEIGAHSLNMLAKYLCKDPTLTTTVIGISIADLQGSGDAWRAIASVGTGSKVETQTNWSNPNVSGNPTTRASVLSVNVFPVDRTVAGRTALVMGTPANDIPAGFTFPTFNATASLRVTYNGGGPNCVLKKVILGIAAP